MNYFGRNMRVLLIVEDSIHDLELLLHVLKPFHWTTVTCTNGEDALELFDPAKFCAVLCDLNLPGMDGVELIAKLRKMSTEVHIDVMTGAEDPRRREQAILAGATGFFTKPYTSSDNQLLLSQLEASSASFKRGKRIKNWRTTVWGSSAAAGGLVWGSCIVMIQTNTHLVPAGIVTTLTLAGLLLNVVGLIGSSVCQADKQDVEDLEKQIKTKL